MVLILVFSFPEKFRGIESGRHPGRWMTTAFVETGAEEIYLYIGIILGDNGK